ncbi:signal peptide peptidase SppA, 36K type [Enhygromyxa salina]|uniref:Signal peptide peptidase SppA, 36K type n=1 Tax=Enhygromyxa salina TaxID=215803 RepID=A0A0C2D487_9BACT|nr:signal peptide peptidase SppA [Enhygromyxa salina]KIG16505.1 signal peptide peptidase SppA, 36K type [Enhygromyxa salina]
MLSWPSRSAALALALISALVVLLATPASARAGNGGEARSILRDPDRPYTVVAGEADASAVVQNPANLAYLDGFNAILDFTYNIERSGRRGDGIGGFVAVPLPWKFPLPWKILALGVGLQAVLRQQAVPGNAHATADAAFGKFTIAAAVPLMRWVPGLSFGLQYSRLFSGENVYASRVNQLDLALSWRANRFVSLAVVARNLNAPTLAESVRAAPVLDPEVALRPFGDARFEVAAGVRARLAGLQPAEAPIRGFQVQPRGRMLFGNRGVRVYAEAEAVAYFDAADVDDPSKDPTQADARAVARVSLGVQLDTPHFGVAAGPTAGLGAGGLHGVSGRVRLSHERYTDILPVRPRRVTRLSLAGKHDDRELAELVWLIDELARRRGGVVLVELAGSEFGSAQLEELREALLRYQDSGGKVVAYLEGASLTGYFLASVADRIIAHPHAALSIIGLSSRTLYWGELLARLGVQAEFVRVAEYKGTPEIWTRTGPSAPVAEANRALMTDTWNHLIRVVGRSRARDPAVVSDWVDAAPWQPEDARRRGIVDDLAWPDELDAKLEAWLGRGVRIEAPPTSPLRTGDWGAPAHVAIVHVRGTLVTGPSLEIPLLGLELAGSETLTKTIAELREDNAVKAVVVRIDSRGGSVRASEQIARELDRTRERKPVVISMGQTAASGGYYIATGGQYIYANATTYTGSIGVFLPKLDLSGLLDKVGVNAELLSIGDRATMHSYWKPYSEDERDAAMAGIQATYDVFIERVAGARAMTPEAADAVARGHVWSGVRAIEIGLVDAYGGMHEAVDRAARMANMPVPAGAAPIVLHYPLPPTVLQKVRRLFGLNLSLPLGSSVEAGGDAAVGIGQAGQLVPMTGRALGFADPLMRTLRLLPAALWHGAGPEALAIGPCYFEIDG